MQRKSRNLKVHRHLLMSELYMKLDFCLDYGSTRIDKKILGKEYMKFEYLIKAAMSWGVNVWGPSLFPSLSLSLSFSLSPS